MAGRVPWWGAVLLGAASVAIGVCLVVRPLTALSVLTLYLGLGLIVTGLFALHSAFTAPQGSRFTLATGALAVVAIVVGVCAILWFDVTLELVAPLVAVTLIVIGVGALIAATQKRTRQRFTAALIGAADVAFGLTALLWPDATLLLLAVIFGVRMIFFGLVVAGEAILAALRRRPRAKPAGPVKPWLRLVGAIALVALAFGAIGVSHFLRQGSPALDAFYSAPDGELGEPGTLHRFEPFTRDVPEGATGWRILYTTLASGELGVATALVVAPSGSTGPHPVIAWAHGTTGYATACAPSALAEPFWSGALFGMDEIVAEGWAVVATDYPGLGTEGSQPYLIGDGVAPAILDSVRAARQLEGLSLDGRTALWGHSQGGHAALWTAQVAPSYAPDVPLSGVVALAPAADTVALTKSLPTVTGGSVFASFVISAYAAEYADVSFERYVTPSAHTLVREMATRCLSERGTQVSVLSALSLSKDRPVFGDDPSTGPLGERLAQNTPSGPFEMPVLLGQGAADTLITPELQLAYVARLCAAGTDVEYCEYAGMDHMGLVSEGSPAPADVIAWTAERFAKPAGAPLPRCPY